MKIRSEQQGDETLIRNIHLYSFPQSAEADLVDALRKENDSVISLVALEDDLIIGHVMFSTMRAPFRALGLAPVAVLPQFRERGVAAALISIGLEQAREEGWEGVFVVGDPDYYGRFGFDAGEAANFISPYAGPFFMAYALQTEELPQHEGRVDYAPAFSVLDKE